MVRRHILISVVLLILVSLCCNFPMGMVMADGVSVIRDLPNSSTFNPGDTFNVTIQFSAPENDFVAIGLSDFTPDSWIVSANVDWCTPAPMDSLVTKNRVDHIWAGPYTAGTLFTAVYQVTIPSAATAGSHDFAGGKLEYYVGNNRTPFVVTITGDSQIMTTSGPTPTPVPPPAGGGGGGGGAAPVGEKSITPIRGLLNSEFKAIEDIEALSVDLKAGVFIKFGTKVVNLVGVGFTSIDIEKLVDKPVPGQNELLVSDVFDFRPDGARFDPTAILTLKYDRKSLPVGIKEANLYIAHWNNDTAGWEKIGSVVNFEKSYLTANVTHFSTYAILASIRPAEFIIGDLQLTPANIQSGERLTVSALITNTGDLSGNYTAHLKINGIFKETKEITLVGGDKTTVSFNIIAGSAGEYVVDINGLSSKFNVVEPVAPGTVAAAPAPLPSTTSPTPPVFTQSTATSKQPEQSTETQPIATQPNLSIETPKEKSQGTNRWLIITSGAGLIFVIGIVIYFMVRRRNLV